MKCKYHKVCELYSEDSATCNKTAGQYQMGKFAGCYYYMEKKLKEAEK